MGLVPITKQLCLIGFFFVVFFSFVSILVNGDDKPSAYEVLQEYGFPAGLLPQGVTGYELNKETGQFSAYLPKTCRYSVESYRLEYKTTISGVISKGKLSKLKGVRVHVLLLWVNIVEVVSDGDELELSVGIASASFGADSFVESPKCGCGFDCYDLDEHRPLVSAY